MASVTGSSHSPPDSSIGFSPPGSILSRSSVSDVSVHDNFMDSEFRAGGPRLCDLPAWGDPSTMRPHYDIFNQHSSEIISAASEILREHDIDFNNILLAGRRSVVDPEPRAIPTLLVLAHRRSPTESWREAARKIYYMLDSFKLFLVSVEILEETLLKPARIFNVLRSDQIYTKWSQIWKEILQNIRHTEWTSIGCYRYGRNDTQDTNPPTILIGVDKDIDVYRKWNYELEEIQQILRRYAVNDTAIQFIKNPILRTNETGFHELVSEHLQEYVQSGVSLGIRGNQLSSGTLGGIVEVLLKDETEYKQYGLTCFHCTYMLPIVEIQATNLDSKRYFVKVPNTEDEKTYNAWYRGPVAKGDDAAMRLLQLDQPSTRDLSETIAIWESRIAFLENDATYQKTKYARENGGFIFPREDRQFKKMEESLQIQRKSQRHFADFLEQNQHMLGHVYAGSGFIRTKKTGSKIEKDLESNLDWALIQIDHRKMGNNEMSKELTKPLFPVGVILTANKKIKEADKPDDSDALKVFKLGRNTGITQGELSKLENVSIAKYPGPDGVFIKIETVENSIIPTSGLGKSFSKEGDSGAFVFTPSGGVLGMLFAGQPATGVGYYTPIKDIFDDIKEVLEAKDVRLLSTD